jgi:multidrug efflux pump subunit AcrA (membrane-fusion protein)
MTRTLTSNPFSRAGLPVLAAAALLMTAACSRSNVQAAAPDMPPPLVTVVKATAQDIPKYLDEIGRNAAFESVTVTPQLGGRIVERHFQDGENLKKGQLLFVICLRFKSRWGRHAESGGAAALGWRGCSPRRTCGVS